ncbi:MAG: HAMP domain-containing protein [Desulfobacterales bacterium]|nr:HAMP domain-containing protein [Desulfobacterales bacterium]MBF0397124.1 HAMP domain-containing protein [Desulfobacterales bacterium]
MKISHKIILLITCSAFLFAASFMISFYFSSQIYGYYDFRYTIKEFENKLLNSIISEKDYAVTFKKDSADKVLNENKVLTELLTKIADKSYGRQQELNSLILELNEYKNTFLDLINKIEKHNSFKGELHKLITDLSQKFIKADEVFIELSATMMVETGSVDKLLSSFIEISKNIMAWTTRLILTINQDLLLEGNEEVFLNNFKRTFKELAKDKDNLEAFTKNINEKAFKDYSEYVTKFAKPFEEVIHNIHITWKEIKLQTPKLDKIREKIILTNTNISKWSEQLLTKSKKNNIKLTILFFGVTLFILIFGGLSIGRSIVNSIKKVVDFAGKLSYGDLSIRLPVLNNSNELDKMSAALNAMADELSFKAETAERIAKGDLTDDVHIASEKDTFSQSLQDMVDNLNKMVSEVNESAKQLATGANEIASSSECLSQTTSEQAASLQEISASMNEIASKTKKNAQNALNANELSKEVSNASKKGVEQMNEMMVSMNTIVSSSKEITKVIKYIEEIAFQTNLLSLNAATEAARAGKHGKGFAVVAQEVRELASKSAKATKDISYIIETSIKNIKSGSEFATKTHKSLEHIYGAVIKVTDLMDQISSATSEQTHGISEMNHALSQMEISTQQNTATAEQTSAAAEELTSQAGHLKMLVSRFKLR